MNENDKVPNGVEQVLLLKRWEKWNRGEIAGFSKAIADALVAQGIATRSFKGTAEENLAKVVQESVVAAQLGVGLTRQPPNEVLPVVPVAQPVEKPEEKPAEGDSKGPASILLNTGVTPPPK